MPFGNFLLLLLIIVSYCLVSAHLTVLCLHVSKEGISLQSVIRSKERMQSENHTIQFSSKQLLEHMPERSQHYRYQVLPHQRCTPATYISVVASVFFKKKVNFPPLQNDKADTDRFLFPTSLPASYTFLLSPSSSSLLP